MARFYQALLDGGAGVWSEATIRQSRRQSTTDGETDRTFGSVIRWAQGFQLAGASMGASPGPDTFGHNGSNCCMGWADPDRDLVVVYLTDRLVPTPAHLAAISDAVRAAC
jgi:CubicO group peptidase (beta-lactamase class C family)